MTTIELICALERIDLSHRDEMAVSKYRIIIDDLSGPPLTAWQARNLTNVARSYGIEAADPVREGANVGPNAIAGFDAGERVLVPPAKSAWQKKAEVESKNGVA